jgi:hypothetical protein
LTVEWAEDGKSHRRNDETTTKSGLMKKFKRASLPYVVIKFLGMRDYIVAGNFYTNLEQPFLSNTYIYGRDNEIWTKFSISQAKEPVRQNRTSR